MLITNKEQLREYYSDKRIWQGIPGIERTKSGRLFATWYSGETKEEIGNFQLVVRSDDGGKSWTEPILIAAPTTNSRCFDGGLWVDPLERLWFWYTEDDSVWITVCNNPDSENLIWDKPRIIGDGVMLNKPIILSSGEWLFPVSVWKESIRNILYTSDRDFTEGTYVYKSSDNGETFTCIGCADIPRKHCDEHMLLEKNDKSIEMYVRTSYGIGISRSYDRGKSWTKGINSDLGGPCSRFHIRRLESGRILLINHHNHNGRNNLTAFLSEDDGKTFPYSLLLDERDNVSYPDATEENGFIYIIYDHERGCFKNSLETLLKDAREILMAKLTEEDIMAGSVKNPHSFLRRIINRLDKESAVKINPYFETKYYSDEDCLQYLLPLNNDKIATSLFDSYSNRWENMNSTDSELLDKLIDNLYENADKTETLAEIIKILRYVPDFPIEKESTYVERILACISENLCSEIDISKLAKELQTSKHYMCYAFEAKTGTSIPAYHNSMRLDNVKKLLISTDISIEEIADKCGFSDSSYFEKQFEAEENMTPNRYRDIHKYLNSKNI